MDISNGWNWSSASTRDRDPGPASARRRCLMRLQGARRVFDRLDWWDVNEWEGSGLWSFCDDGAALLLVPLDLSPGDVLEATRATTAWVRWCAVADDGKAPACLRRLFDEAETRLAAHGVREVWCIVRSFDWLRPYLRERGYRPASRLLTFQMEPERMVDASPLPASLWLRPAHAGDFDVVCGLDAVAFDEPWRYPPALMRLAFERAFAVTVAACADGIVGYACSLLHQANGHIVRLAVRPSLRLQGIGAGLLMDSVARLRQAGAQAVSLNTQSDNRAAQRLYRRLGFALLDEKPAVLRKPIGPAADGGVT